MKIHSNYLRYTYHDLEVVQAWALDGQSWEDASDFIHEQVVFALHLWVTHNTDWIIHKDKDLCQLAGTVFACTNSSTQSDGWVANSRLS